MRYPFLVLFIIVVFSLPGSSLKSFRPYLKLENKPCKQKLTVCISPVWLANRERFCHVDRLSDASLNREVCTLFNIKNRSKIRFSTSFIRFFSNLCNFSQISINAQRGDEVRYVPNLFYANLMGRNIMRCAE